MLVDQFSAIMGGIEDKCNVEEVNNKEKSARDPVRFANTILSKVWRENVNQKKDVENAKA